MNSIKRRIIKLEARSAPQREYVYRFSNAIKPAEAERIANAKREGHGIVILPHMATSDEEWLANYSPFGNL
jgi:hypothetical protein